MPKRPTAANVGVPIICQGCVRHSQQKRQFSRALGSRNNLLLVSGWTLKAEPLNPIPKLNGPCTNPGTRMCKRVPRGRKRSPPSCTACRGPSLPPGKVGSWCSGSADLGLQKCRFAGSGLNGFGFGSQFRFGGWAVGGGGLLVALARALGGGLVLRLCMAVVGIRGGHGLASG